MSIKIGINGFGRIGNYITRKVNDVRSRIAEIECRVVRPNDKDNIPNNVRERSYTTRT